MHPYIAFCFFNWEWATRDVGLGQEIPMWKAVALLRIPLAGRPSLTGQAGICRKEETGWLMHLVIPLIRLLQPFQRQGGKERDREPNTIFSQRGTRAQHSWHCHWPPNNPYSILCVLGVWMATVCEPHRPSLPSEGEQPTLPAHSEPRTRPSLRPQPLSQTLDRLRRHCWTIAQAWPLLKTHSRK